MPVRALSTYTLVSYGTMNMYHYFVPENSYTPSMKVFVFNLLTQGLVPLNLVIFETLSLLNSNYPPWVGIDIFWKLSHISFI